MSQLVKELYMYAGDAGYISISKPPIAYPSITTVSNEAFLCGRTQGFIWHPEFVAFHLLHVIDCDVKIFISDKIEVEEDSVRAIVVPFSVPEHGVLNISDDNPSGSFEMNGGHYKLLYQVRRLTDEEIRASKNYEEEELEDVFYLIQDDDRERPELCFLTFIPTDSVIEAEILRQDTDLSPPSKLLLLDESSSYMT